MKRALLVLLALASAPIAQAQTQAQAQAVAPPSAAPADPRVRTLPYDPDAVVELDLSFGFQTMIRFSDDEHIENVSIGDGQAWQVTPNKAATLLFVKPVDIATRTNMTVVTDRRSYLFELSAHSALRDGAEPPYVIRFAYPAPPPKPAAAAADQEAEHPPERRNSAYSYTGSRTNLPSVVFDDGKFTYFKWPETAATPALFMVAPTGAESLVNYSMRDGYLVVQQLAPRFILRDGKQVTTVINDAWREPVPGADAPRPADSRTARAAAQHARSQP
jgi:type IV secretion system protein VirB9